MFNFSWYQSFLMTYLKKKDQEKKVEFRHFIYQGIQVRDLIGLKLNQKLPCWQADLSFFFFTISSPSALIVSLHTVVKKSYCDYFD